MQTPGMCYLFVLNGPNPVSSICSGTHFYKATISIIILQIISIYRIKTVQNSITPAFTLYLLFALIFREKPVPFYLRNKIFQLSNFCIHSLLTLNIGPEDLRQAT